MAEDSAEDMHRQELETRVLYSVMLGCVRLAKLCGLSLKDAVSLLQMAYFHELRGDGMSMDEITEALDISKRTTARLSKQLKTNFFRPEREHDLPRRIECLLWAEPMSQAQILRELSATSDEITEALRQLLVEERIIEQPGRALKYSVARLSGRLVKPGWTSRIGALNSLVGNIADVVKGRFFGQDPHSFARTLTLRVRKQDTEQLRALYETQVWPFLEALDQASAGHDETLEFRVSMCWAEQQTQAPQARQTL